MADNVSNRNSLLYRKSWPHTELKLLIWWVVAIIHPYFIPSKITRPNQGGYALLQVTTQEFKKYQVIKQALTPPLLQKSKRSPVANPEGSSTAQPS